MLILIGATRSKLSCCGRGHCWRWEAAIGCQRMVRSGSLQDDLKGSDAMAGFIDLSKVKKGMSLSTRRRRRKISAPSHRL